MKPCFHHSNTHFLIGILAALVLLKILLLF
jgi:hypothetical protein